MLLTLNYCGLAQQGSPSSSAHENLLLVSCAGDVIMEEQSSSLVTQHLHHPLPDPLLPVSCSQVLQWLFTFTQLQVPVTDVFYQQMRVLHGPQQHLLSCSRAASAVVTFTELLQTNPAVPFSSEDDTSMLVRNFIGRCWATLESYSPTKLHHDLLFNKSSQLSNVSSHAVATKLRPNVMLVAQRCTLLLGEDKYTNLQAAVTDLERKRVNLSDMHYGPVRFLLGYAAAGTMVRWYYLPSSEDQVMSLMVHQCACPCSPQTQRCLQPVKEVGSVMDLRGANERLSFMLTLVQAHRLLGVMSSAVPALPGRLPLYSEIERESSMYVFATPMCASACHAIKASTLGEGQLSVGVCSAMLDQCSVH